MARIRSIKPEFWTSEQIVDCSAMARLMFIGLWNFCDDAGIHPASERRIKMSIFPGDDIDGASIRRLLVELSSNGLIELYNAEGVEYLIVTGWENHQKIDRPTFKHPKPSKDHHKAPKHSSNDCRTLDERHPPEGKGEEGKEGKDKKENNTAVSNSEEEKKPDAVKSELHPRYREVQQRVETLLSNPNLLVFGHIDAWLKSGADPDVDIYPTLDRLKPKWKSSSLEFFSKAVGESLASRATRLLDGSVEIATVDPYTDLDPNERRWLSRLDGFWRRQFWLEDQWGPKPGEAGHRCPQHLTERYQSDQRKPSA